MACERSDTMKLQPKKELIIILDDLDLSWTSEQIQKATFMWTSGWTIEEMARKLRPYDKIKDAIDEVGLLVMHLRRQSKIELREGGVFGYGTTRENKNS